MRAPEDESDHVRREWHRVYATHAEAFRIRRPARIGRLARRDLPRLLLEVCGPSRQRVLEAGCGSGQDALFLASRGHDVTALDADARPLKALEAARDEWRASWQRSISLATCLGDLMDPPLERASCDVVFNSGVVEHLSPDLRARAIAAMASMLRPGGRIVVVVPNAWHPMSAAWAWLIDRTTDHRAFDLDERAVGVDDLRADLERAGCDPISTAGIDPWRTLELHPSWLPLRALARAAERVDPFPRLARERIATRLVVVGLARSRPSGDRS